MKLASFYGLTAPFMLILYEKVDETTFKLFASKLDNTADHSKLEDAKAELMFFEKALAQLPWEYESSFEDDLLSIYDGYIKLDKGTVLQFNGDVDELKQNVCRYLMYHIALNLTTPRFLEHLDLSVFTQPMTESSMRSDLRALAENAYRNANVFLKDIEKCAIKAARHCTKPDAIITNDEATAFTQIISSIFHLKKKYDSTFDVNGETITLTDDEYKVMMYYVDRLDKVHACNEAIKLQNVSADQIFTVPFQDLVYRKPTSLFSEMNKLFKGLNTAQQGQFLVRARDNAIEQIQLFDRLFKETVVSHADKNKVYGLTFDEALDSLQGKEDTEVYGLIASGNLNVAEMDESTLHVLDDVGELIKSFDLDDLNMLFGTHFTVTSFSDAISNLNKIGLCGLNLYSNYLFERMVVHSSFNLFKQVPMSDDRINEFMHVESEIIALLECLRPIGGSVDEKLVSL